MYVCMYIYIYIYRLLRRGVTAGKLRSLMRECWLSAERQVMIAHTILHYYVSIRI